MENSVENSDGTESGKKSRSLDIHSFYVEKSQSGDDDKCKNLISKRNNSGSNGNGVSENGVGGGEQGRGQGKSKKRKSVKSLSSFESAGKKNRKSLSEINGGGKSGSGMCLDSADVSRGPLGLSPNSNGNGTSLISIPLKLNDNVIHIPKRKRGFVGKRKFDARPGNERRRLSNSPPSSYKVSSLSHIDKLTADFGSRDVLPKVKGKKLGDCLKADVSCKIVSSHHDKEEGSPSAEPKVKSKKLVDNSKGNVSSETASAYRVKKDGGPSAEPKVKAKKIVDDLKTSLLSKTISAHHDKEEGVPSADPKVNSKKLGDDLKADASVKTISADHVKEEGGPSVQHNGELSFRKPHRSRKRKKDMGSRSQATVEVKEFSLDKSVKINDDLLEEDEENLEQNAARMLSSRFDPSCTGFTSNRTSASPSSNGLSYLMPNRRNSVGSGSKNRLGLRSGSSDAADRILRPRKQHKLKGVSRKRRHFYELSSKDLDPHWVLNQKIKVFWPLDQSWYFGLVNDYDPERKLHHVKYDDRDEEWINLENERFKLLLLPSEVPGRSEKKKSTAVKKVAEKRKEDITTNDDSYMGSCMDSEPIISWLARSARHVKSSSVHFTKKQKQSNISPDSVSQGTGDEHRDLGQSPLKRDKICLSHNSALPASSVDARRSEESVSQSTSYLHAREFPLVYFRRRKRGQRSCHASESKYTSRTASGSDSYSMPADEGYGFLEGYKNCTGGKLLFSVDKAGTLSTPEIKYKLCFPVDSLLSFRCAEKDFQIFQTLLLLHHGAMMSMWPMVYLEMLCVDNTVGLRFLLFEGCLKQAIAFVFQVLAVFHLPDRQAEIVEQQLPVTSIRFKFSCTQDLRRKLVFAFYYFSKVRSTRLSYLDSNLGRHCLLSKQLPLSKCTYDNIKALETGIYQLPRSSVRAGPTSSQGFWRSKQGMTPFGVSREATYMRKNEASCSSDQNHGTFPPFSLSFTAAPTFFLGLHLKLLMERSVTCISFRDRDSSSLIENLDSSVKLVADDCSSAEDCPNDPPENITENSSGTFFRRTPGSRWLSHTESENVAVAAYRDGKFKNSRDKARADLKVVQSSDGFHVYDNKFQSSNHLQQLRDLPSHVSHHEDNISPGKLDDGNFSRLNGLSVEIPACSQVEKPIDRRIHSSQLSSGLAWTMDRGIIRSPNPTAPRSMWHRNRSISGSPSSGYPSHLWSDGKVDFVRDGFGAGPKKPRTQVSYTFPNGGLEVGPKPKSSSPRGFPCKRIRRSSEKRVTDSPRNSQRNLELLSCEANVLITLADRGYRQCGAQVTLELFDHNEWRLAVKLSGTTSYSYKAHQFLQPGTTNRYTHVMMWKGGKDWILEFPDRSQWMLFKELHEECYNRNIRAASIKNIPIPGVRLIEECDDNGIEVPFVLSSPKYFRQVETDVDMAMDPTRVLYDMDSDDERWLQTSSRAEKISEDLFEKTMDMFEKVSYAQQQDHFTPEEIDELMDGAESMEVIKMIHKHWQHKRQQKGMPLVRHLQPPLWEKYQQQVKEWELAMSKASTSFSNGCQGKVLPIEKPPMFAFCLKPRGLEVPNKGSKQRSQRKFLSVGHSNHFVGDHDSFHLFGRRSNGFAFGDEKVIYSGYNNEYSDASPLLQPSPRIFSPRDAGSAGYFSLNSDGSERNHHPKLYRSKSKKIMSVMSPNDQQMMAVSYNQRMMSKRNGVHRSNMGLSERSIPRHYMAEGSQRHHFEQLDSLELDEFRLRDASGAAQHARNMAKLKREKAQRLLYRADLAIHKAAVALMTAEAIKAAEDSNAKG
ncbi:Enhancer of polycomb-like, N-terminal [Dillenia turbinata]|uniref:Enhancer of polycomb-like protein n=1 Tax=Dillenia turbinata TaxID=194707 RepID=A0AAN8UC27_9MAGN